MAKAKTVTVTISEEGDLTFLAGNRLADDLAGQGDTVRRRASHVEPANEFLRGVFHFLRSFGDDTPLAEWTRTWPCLWRVNTAPVGGYVLRIPHLYNQGQLTNTWETAGVALFRNRQDAIDAEIKFLDRWFLEGGR